MFSAENDYLQIEVNSKGAELTRIFSKPEKLDFLWHGDPAYWAKHSPVLFPIVGTLKNNTYYFNNKSYTLSRHGFARDMDFQLSARTDSSLTFTLSSNEETLSKYPFNFKLNITYALESSRLAVGYKVSNTGDHEMYFSIGGHPAFRVPLEENAVFEDYYLEFGDIESAGRWPISTEGLIEALPLDLLHDTKELQLTHDLFSRDAIVLKYLNSKWLKLRSRTSFHGLEFHFAGFPFLGIWSAKNADFVCIEPWCGISDSVAGHQELIAKEGINMITPGQIFTREWSVGFF